MHSFDIGAQERRGIFDAAVHMGLRREVDDGIETEAKCRPRRPIRVMSP